MNLVCVLYITAVKPKDENNHSTQLIFNKEDCNTYSAILLKKGISETLLFTRATLQKDPCFTVFLVFSTETIDNCGLVPSDLEGFLYLPFPDINDIEEGVLLQSTLQKFADLKKPWDKISSAEVNGAKYSPTLPLLIQLN